MASSSLGTKRQPQFADGDAPDLAVNPSEVSDYAAEFGNHKIGTTADRTAASSWAWEALTWEDTTTGFTYKWTGSVWKVVLEDTGWITPTLGSSWASAGAGYQDLAYRRLNGVTRFRGAAFGSGAADPLFTLPAGFRPDIASGKELFVQVANGGTAATTTRVVFRANGQVATLAGTSPNFDIISFIAAL